MKKNYFLTLLLTICFSVVSFGQTPVITAIVDGDCAGGNPKLLEIYAKGTVDFTLYSLENQTNANTDWNNPQDLSSFGTVTDGFVYVSTSGSSAGLTSDFPSVSSVLETNTMNVNGDDRLRIILTSDSSVIDQYGTEGTDGSNQTWEYKDSYAKRKNGTGPDAGFNEANWTFAGAGTFDTLGVCQGGSDTFETLMSGVGTYTSTASNNPSLVITSPAAFSMLNTTSVTPTITVANFNVSGDNGSGATDGTGDGFIKSTFLTQGGTTENANFFSATLPAITVAPGNTYTLTLELVDNAGASLATAVSSSVTFTVQQPCDLVLGDMATTCDASTSGTDSYSGTIAFTVGNTGTIYTITAPAGITVGGDNPNTVVAGTITFTGMTEGTDAEIKIVGDANSSCDYTKTFSSPTCISLPISEDFTYADGSLTNNPLWNNFSGTPGDLMVSSGQALVQHGTPNEDAQMQFTAVSGSIYYSLDFTVVDPGSPISGTDNEYFAMFKDSGFGFAGRIDIVPPAATGDFSVGIASDASTADSTWATDLTYGVKYRATVKYDQVNNIAQLWIDAALETETSILGADATDPGRSIVAFALRQSDSDLNEGILIDNLKIGTTFSETALSVEKTEVEGFAAYPNPVKDKKFTVRTSSSSNKQINIFNVLGKKVFTQTFSGLQKTMDVSVLNSGIYILKVTEDGKTATKKLVIR